MTTEADPIEISNLEVVHGLDEHVDALVPLLPVSWEPDQDRMPLAATIEAIPEFTVNDGDGMYVSSSLLSETDTWHVTDVTAAQDGVAHVAFGRGGEQEARFQLYGGAANGLRTGITILGTDILWTGGGFLGLGKAQVDFLPDPDPPAPITIMIPIMRLHRPKPEGCEATYYAEVSGGQNAEMTLKVLGVGAGGGFKITMKISEEYTARKSCVETVIPAKFQLIPGRTLVNGAEVAYASGQR
ncbi:hypothetical protein ACTXG7_14250 [Mycolicibacterium sp. Dal123E01]|uniref:hypothetical protein n=1 Tax=Mycolicibacterium sp. Dal123E01 TaxID=3457578 RepID=UPI00403ED8C0